MKRHTNAFLDARFFFSLMCFTPLCFSPAAAETEGAIVVICHYRLGDQDWTIDLSARTASVEYVPSVGAATSIGVVTEVTEKEITWQLDAAPHDTRYKLNRYSLNLTRNVYGRGDEAPIPCELRRKQF